MKKLINFIKWRALFTSLILSVIVGFLYGRGKTSESVLIVLSVAVILHIILFYFLLIKDIKRKSL